MDTDLCKDVGTAVSDFLLLGPISFAWNLIIIARADWISVAVILTLFHLLTLRRSGRSGWAEVVSESSEITHKTKMLQSLKDLPPATQAVHPMSSDPTCHTRCSHKTSCSLTRSSVAFKRRTNRAEFQSVVTFEILVFDLAE